MDLFFLGLAGALLFLGVLGTFFGFGIDFGDTGGVVSAFAFGDGGDHDSGFAFGGKGDTATLSTVGFEREIISVLALGGKEDKTALSFGDDGDTAREIS